MAKAVETFPEYNSWCEFYPEAEEVVPEDRPEPTPGRKAQITVLVDADHAHCAVTRRSIMGILVFVNSTPVRWYSKLQRTVETSTYWVRIGSSKDSHRYHNGI
jgi:hypothetical protein